MVKISSCLPCIRRGNKSSTSVRTDDRLTRIEDAAFGSVNEAQERRTRGATRLSSRKPLPPIPGGLSESALRSWIGEKLSKWRRVEGNSEWSRVASLRIAEAFVTRSTELDLSRLYLRSLPKAIRYLKLRELNLSNNCFRKFPKTICSFISLWKLDLSGNWQLRCPPNMIGCLKELRELQLGQYILRGKRLVSLPSTIRDLQNLRILNLRGNWIKTIPNALGDLLWLEELDLSGNRRISGLEVLQRLPRLRIFNLERVGSAVSFEAIGGIAELEELNLSRNWLRFVPDAIGNLSQLRKLDLSFSRLSDLPGSMGELEQLEELNLSSSNFRLFPGAVGGCTQLRSLDLCNNELNELSHAIGHLKNLEVLDLGANRLTHLPNAFWELTKLRRLNIEMNQFEELPERVGSLRQLEKLRAADNSLTFLPNALVNLRNLEFLDIEGNPLLRLPMCLACLPKLTIWDPSGRVSGQIYAIECAREEVNRGETLEESWLYQCLHARYSKEVEALSSLISGRDVGEQLAYFVWLDWLSSGKGFWSAHKEVISSLSG